MSGWRAWRKSLGAVASVAALGLGAAACSSPPTTSATGTSGATSTSSTTTTTTTTTLPATSTSTTTSTTVAVVKACSGGQLHLAKNDETGTAGTFALGLAVTNSGSPCTIDGYPSVTLVGQSGSVPTTDEHHGQGPAFTIAPSRVLVGGGGAGFVVEYSNVAVDGETSCPTTTSMNVTLPGLSDPIAVVYTMQACGGPTIDISAVLTSPQEQAQFTG